jgi:pimeloyl-ACP methyl ester carboxylesterase
MATFVLVHGSWHGAWCWHRVVPELEALGHRVLAPDLPGHGDDATAPAQLTLKAYAECVATVICSATEPVVLVGHSFAGIVISQVAELVPERISRLVYLTAFLPANGQSLSRLATADPRQSGGHQLDHSRRTSNSSVSISTKCRRCSTPTAPKAMSRWPGSGCAPNR